MLWPPVLGTCRNVVLVCQMHGHSSAATGYSSATKVVVANSATSFNAARCRSTSSITCFGTTAAGMDVEGVPQSFALTCGLYPCPFDAVHGLLCLDLRWLRCGVNGHEYEDRWRWLALLCED